jgi:HAD superfamily hydrolase (TIGR01549 family)
MTYNAVIFDLDGTLVGTDIKYAIHVVGKTLATFGRTADDHSIKRFWYEARRNDIVSGVFGVDLEDFYSEFTRQRDREMRLALTKPYDDTHFLDALLAKGYKLGIVTGASVEVAELELDMIGSDKFDAIVLANGHNGIARKPDPHGINECMELLGVDNSTTVYVGNSDEDVLAAKAARVMDVMINRGEHDFPHVEPSARINVLPELQKILNFQI